MTERVQSFQAESKCSRVNTLIRSVGRVASRSALIFGGIATAFTGITVAEAAMDRQTPAHADGWGDKYNEFASRANAAERSWCMVPSRIKLCYDIMKNIADEATASAEYVVQSQGWDASELHNGRADAFRHCFFMAKVTREHGVFTAKEFGDRHEQGVPDGMLPQPADEKAMDLQNNIEGRYIGTTEGSIFNRCVAAAVNGRLVTIN
jgi:hypothetical protein